MNKTHLKDFSSAMDLRPFTAFDENAEHLSLALDAAGVGTMEWNLAEGKVLGSARTCEIFGIENGSQSAKLADFYQRIHPEDRGRVASSLKEAAGACGGYKIEARILKKDGEACWVAMHGKVLSDGKAARLIGAVVDITLRKREDEKIRMRGARAQLLSEALAQLLNAQNPETVVRELFPKVAAHLKADVFFNFMVDETGTALKMNSCLGVPAEVAKSMERLAFGQAVCGTAAAGKKAVIAHDIQNSEDQKAALLRPLGIQACVCHPLMAGERLLGTLSFASRSRRAFDEEEIEFMRMISQYAAIALDRLRNTEAFKKSEEHLRLAIDAGKVGIWDWDIPENKVVWSEQVYEFHGLKPDEFDGKLETFVRLVHPADRERVSGAVRYALEHLTPYSIEMRVVRPTGEVRWISTNGRVIADEHHKPVRMLGATVDITDDRQAEEAVRSSREELARQVQELRRLHEMSFRLVSVTGLQSILQEVLRAAIAMHHTDKGLLSLCCPDAKGLRTRVSQGFDPAFLQMVDFVPFGRGACGTAFKERRRIVVENTETDPVFEGFREGARLAGFSSCYSTPLITHQNKIIGVVTVYFALPYRPSDREMKLMDVYARMAADVIEAAQLREQAARELAERKRAEEALKKYAEELAHSNYELEQFAHVSSHDLQEPLRTISNYVDLLVMNHRDQLEGEAREFLEFIQEGSLRALELIRELLAYASIGAKEQARRVCSFDTLLDQVLLGLQTSVRESGAEIIRGPLPELFVNDVQIQQLFQNLISNAIKYSGKRNPRIEISSRKEGDKWVFWVADNGIGIKPEYKHHIFLIFKRLHSRSEYPGTGIGLAICKKIVQYHGGEIWVESQPGQGSTFHFTLPETRLS